jgi:F-type H+-transporting ATPase subunit a
MYWNMHLFPHLPNFSGALAAETQSEPGGPLWLLPHIDVSPELFHIGPFTISNTLFTAWIAIAVVLGIMFAATRKMSIIPKGLQNFVEWAIGLLLDFCEEIAGPKWGRRFFPLVATIFLYVLFANWLSIVPGVESIGTPEAGAQTTGGIFLIGDQSNKLLAWLRPASTDINFTLSLALISVIVTQIYGFRALGFRVHISKYFPLNVMGLIIGILELIGEFARIISFSFRLFGNVFAGDVLLLVLGTLVPFVGPTLFYPLEMFVGFIQAFVFSALTLVFLSQAVTSHDEHDNAHAVEAHH